MIFGAKQNRFFLILSTIFASCFVNCYRPVIAWRGSRDGHFTTSLSQASSSSTVSSTGGTSSNDYPLTSSSTIRTADILSLDSIRSTLVRQEETIIFALIERAQYRRNRVIYDANSSSPFDLEGCSGQRLSFLSWMLLETEKLHAKVRRYTSPEEHPFFPNSLPKPILPELQYPPILMNQKDAVDVNKDVMKWYVNKIIDRICQPGDDEQHGSSVLCDIAAMQALSRRVHYGKFVAESKFQKDPETYTQLVRAGNITAIIDLLTNVEVERRVLRRAFVKASTYGRDITGTTEGYKVDPMLIANIYRDMIIPLTKDVEVRYLFCRVGAPPPNPETYFSYCRGPMDAFDDPNSMNDLGISPTSSS